MKKIFLVAGETSGDAHGAALMRELRTRDADGFEFRGVGGEQMHALAGPAFVDWLEEAAVLGLWEVLNKYGYFKREFDRVLAEIDDWRPDAVILIDYPGFNLRLAKALRKRHPKLKIIYYISPQVWAWNRGRIPKMAKWLDLMLCIFPFEKDLYEASGLHTQFIGHPMIDALEDRRIDAPREDDLVGLFPGSREREIAKIFPIQLEAARIVAHDRPAARFAVAAARPTLAGRIHEIAGAHGMADNITVETGVDAARELMQRCAAGIVTSGTATLEAAFFGLPYCLVYMVAWPTYRMGKLLVRVPWLGIVNIIAGKETVKEFVQGDAKPPAIAGEVLRLLGSPDARADLQHRLAEVVDALGEGGAHIRAADAVMAELR